jgi:hypothetical protein
MTIKTQCDGCVFAQFYYPNESSVETPHPSTREDTQTGCSLKRHTLLEVAETNDDGYFVLNRFCNTYRPDAWLQELDLEEALSSEKTVLQEVFPRMGFFVRFETDDPEDTSIEDLDTTIASIKQVTNGEIAYVAVINDKVEYNDGIWSILTKCFEETDTKYHIVQLRASPESVTSLLDAAFLHAQNGWIYATTSGESVPSNVLDQLHEITNVKMQQLVMVEPYDDFNGLIFPAYLFKFLNGNRGKVFHDEILDSRSFQDKVRSAEERGKTSSILTWEEFNAP